MAQPFNEVMEQVETAAVQIAMVVAAYYETLKEKGVPEALAKQLVAEFQAKWLEAFWAKPK